MRDHHMRRTVPLMILLHDGAPRKRYLAGKLATMATMLAMAVLTTAAMVAPVRAAELGDVVVRSYIGQQLSADIELIALAPDEINSLQVRLARPDVYRGANITMNPALAGVRFSVVRRDQRQFLHIATQQSIDAGHVHLFVELIAAGRQDVRGATLWLQPDPNPAPVAVVAPPAAAVPAAVVLAPALAPVAGSPAPSEAALTAARMRAARPKPAPLPEVEQAGPLRDVPAPGARIAAARRLVPAAVPHDKAEQPSIAAHEKAEQPSIAAHGKAEQPSIAVHEKAEQPSIAAHGKTDQPSAVLQAARVQAAQQPPLKTPDKTLSCAATTGGMTPRECVALDTRNAALSSKLVELEGKVRQLQSALQGAASATMVKAPPAAEAKPGAHASVAAQHAAAAATAAASQPAPSAEAAASTPKRLVRTLPKLKYKKEKPPEQGMSAGIMAAIGAAALALLGGGAWYWLRGRRGSKGGNGGNGGNGGKGRGPLAVWQGWRKKNPVAPAQAADIAEPAEARIEPQ